MNESIEAKRVKRDVNGLQNSQTSLVGMPGGTGRVCHTMVSRSSSGKATFRNP